MELHDELEYRRKIIDRELAKTLKLERTKLHQAMSHLPLAGGKRLRPILAMLTCDSVGGKEKTVLPFALALELVHNFTLVHDDLMDQDEFRRGVSTVHAKYNSNLAIISGDALFARAFEVLAKLKKDKLTYILPRFSQMVREIAEGQYLDMEFEERERVTEEEYFKMVEKKTARIIQVACWGGTLIGEGTPRQIQHLSEYGRLLGIGFQIADDLLGVVGKEKHTGKPVGSDLRRGKKTLIITHALAVCGKEERNRVLQVLGKTNVKEEKIRETIALLRTLGSLNYAREKAKEYVKRAKKHLQYLPSTHSRAMLQALADFVVEREE